MSDIRRYNGKIYRLFTGFSNKQSAKNACKLFKKDYYCRVVPTKKRHPKYLVYRRRR